MKKKKKFKFTKNIPLTLKDVLSLRWRKKTFVLESFVYLHGDGKIAIAEITSTVRWMDKALITGYSFQKAVDEFTEYFVKKYPDIGNCIQIL